MRDCDVSYPACPMVGWTVSTARRAQESRSRTWGTTAAERTAAFPCDGVIAAPDDRLYRGVTVQASAATVYRWLCQLRAAPYSYDWIDNRGRQSPRHLIAGLDDLAVGQSVMGIFTLVDFRRDDHLTIRIKPRTAAFRLFGDVAGTYRVAPSDGPACRLLAKLVVCYPPGIAGAFMRRLLPWGDLVMMRRQLLNLKALAEAGERDTAPP